MSKIKRRKGRVTAKLRLHPDPILTKICEPVKDGEDVSGIIRDMRYVLGNSKTGVGLAAPQAGYLKRIIIAKDIMDNYHVMINPKICEGFEATSREMISGPEGCLSYPGKTKVIERHKWIEVHWYNENWTRSLSVFEDLPARIIQHEIDHLNGKCKVGE